MQVVAEVEHLQAIQEELAVTVEAAMGHLHLLALLELQIQEVAEVVGHL
jgi:hypothetical protein